MTTLPALTLVLGGMRSGKSEYAERLIEAHGPGVYIATAQVLDTEMAERVRRHRERRGDSWATVEEPLDLAETLGAHGATGRAVLIDCLTLWLSNLLAAGRDAEVETAALAAALARLLVPVVMVSNEVGLGIVPDNALARVFADAAGRLNQAMAAAADRVVLVSAGLPLVLKEGGP